MPPYDLFRIPNIITKLLILYSSSEVKCPLWLTIVTLILVPGQTIVSDIAERFALQVPVNILSELLYIIISVSLTLVSPKTPAVRLMFLLDCAYILGFCYYLYESYIISKLKIERLRSLLKYKAYHIKVFRFLCKFLMGIALLSLAVINLIRNNAESVMFQSGNDIVNSHTFDFELPEISGVRYSYECICQVFFMTLAVTFIYLSCEDVLTSMKYKKFQSSIPLAGYAVLYFFLFIISPFFVSQPSIPDPNTRLVLLLLLWGGYCTDFGDASYFGLFGASLLLIFAVQILAFQYLSNYQNNLSLDKGDNSLNETCYNYIIEYMSSYAIVGITIYFILLGWTTFLHTEKSDTLYDSSEEGEKKVLDSFYRKLDKVFLAILGIISFVTCFYVIFNPFFLASSMDYSKGLPIFTNMFGGSDLMVIVSPLDLDNDTLAVFISDRYNLQPHYKAISTDKRSEMYYSKRLRKVKEEKIPEERFINLQSYNNQILALIIHQMKDNNNSDNIPDLSPDRFSEKNRSLIKRIAVSQEFKDYQVVWTNERATAVLKFLFNGFMSQGVKQVPEHYDDDKFVEYILRDLPTNKTFWKLVKISLERYLEIGLQVYLDGSDKNRQITPAAFFNETQFYVSDELTKASFFYRTTGWNGFKDHLSECAVNPYNRSTSNAVTLTYIIPLSDLLAVLRAKKKYNHDFKMNLALYIAPNNEIYHHEKVYTRWLENFDGYDSTIEKSKLKSDIVNNCFHLTQNNIEVLEKHERANIVFDLGNVLYKMKIFFERLWHIDISNCQISNYVKPKYNIHCLYPH